MTRERRAHRDIGGFLIANFANHQHLWVLPQEMTRRGGKIQSPSFIDFGLHHARNDLLGRIFHGNDMPAPALAKSLKTGVYRRCFSATRRTGKQQETRRLAEEAV